MEEEDLKTCPYNSSHKVQPLRFASHIQKCKKANPHMAMKTCPYNATHMMHPRDFGKHLHECDSKDDFVGFSVPTQSLGACAASPTSLQNLSSSFEEDWDAEIEKDQRERAESLAAIPEGYLPVIDEKMKRILYLQIRRFPDAALGLGKSGRRRWNEAEILRLQTLNRGESIEHIEFPTADGSTITIGEQIYGVNWHKSSNDEIVEEMKKMNIEGSQKQVKFYEEKQKQGSQKQVKFDEEKQIQGSQKQVKFDEEKQKQSFARSKKKAKKKFK